MKFSSKALSRFKHIAPKRLRTLVLVGCVLNLPQLQAGVLFTFVEDGGNVVATTSGTIASGWSRNFFAQNSTSDGSALAYDGIRGTRAGGIQYFSTGGFWTFNEMLTRDVSPTTAGVSSGDTFGYGGSDNFFVPAGTNVGDAITPVTTITWSNATYESLGLDTGLSTTPLVLFTLDNSETISAVRGELVPEPTSIAFMATGGLAAGVVAAARRRRRTGARS